MFIADLRPDFHKSCGVQASRTACVSFDCKRTKLSCFVDKYPLLMAGDGSLSALEAAGFTAVRIPVKLLRLHIHTHKFRLYTACDDSINCLQAQESSADLGPATPNREKIEVVPKYLGVLRFAIVRCI
jgi:hypothetical protein